MNPRPIWLIAGLALLASLVWPAPGRAHVGAPYPVLLEEPVGPYVVSALADPDVGVGTFIAQVNLTNGSPAPAGTSVSLWAEPEDGHTPLSGAFTAERRETRRGERFVAEVPFDARGMWRIRMQVSGPAGRGETTFTVRVTPAGPGLLTTLACLAPFALVAALWALGLLRAGKGRRRSDASPGAQMTILYCTFANLK